jgi:hypothetical protein
MMFIPDVNKALRRKYRTMVFALGWVSPIVIFGLLLGTLFASSSHLILLSIGCFFLTLLVSVANVFRLAYMIFGTRGEAHYFLTFWNMLDVLVANLLANISIPMIIWNMSRLTTVQQYKLTDVSVSPWFALLQLGVYTINLISGAGVVREEPLTLLGEFFLAPQMAFNIIIIVIIVLPAAIAALGVHTDEKPGENVNGGEKK